MKRKLVDKMSREINENNIKNGVKVKPEDVSKYLDNYKDKKPLYKAEEEIGSLK